ncbi:DUF3822 family protein [Bizionia sp. KMM 8389]
MAITNNKNSIISTKNLSIQISLNGLSFCILNTESNAVEYLKNRPTQKRETPYKILDLLIECFESDEQLQEPFQNIQVIHENELATLVPEALFQEANLADYLKFNSKILRSDFISFDRIEENNSVAVYVPYVNINNYIYEQFGTFSYRHFSTILIDQLLKQEIGETDTKMYVHVEKSHFEIVVIKASKLLLYNSYEYTSKEDFIYYILYTAEQLDLDPNSFPLLFMGQVSENDELHSIAYKYIRHVRFANRKDSYLYLQKPESNHAFFTLIHSL